MAIRVLVADDHEIMREGICALLRKCEETEVVGQAADGRVAVDMVSKLRPDLMIIDVEMPNLNGIEATRQMIGLHPNLKVMALSAHAEGDLVAKMIKAGARGYMHKASAFSELKEGIRTMLEGEIFLCSRISKVAFSNYIHMILNPNLAETDGLSRRQREVLQLIAEGYPTKDISERFKLRPRTVGVYREHIIKKLGIRTVPELTKYALHVELVKL